MELKEIQDKPAVKFEILRAENIIPSVRESHKLPESGLIIKTSTRTSPSQDRYELVSSPFLERLNRNIGFISKQLIGKINSMK